MRRGAKPAKAKVEAKLPSARKSRKNEGSTVSDLAKRLAEALQREAEATKREAEALGKLQTRDHELVEAREQQAATSEILRVISRSPTDAQPVFKEVAQSAARLCQAQFCHVFRFDGALLHVAAHHGLSPEGVVALQSVYPSAPGRGSVAGRSIFSGRIEQIPDINADADYSHTRIAAIMNYQSIVAVPMLRDGMPIGSIVAGRSNTGFFPERLVTLLQTFAEQAVIAIENVRLFNETKEALEQQTATAEILRVISRSQTDVQPVFDAIVRSAVRLCDGLFSALYQFDGELLHYVAQHNYTPEALEEVHRVFPARPTRALAVGRAILERAVVHIPDIELDPEWQHPALSRAIGFRSGLFVPMLRERCPIGVIVVTRAEPGPFSDNEIELLKTFADQAVIAIENARLFKELEARNRDLTEALDQQTATAEILRVISSSPTGVRPVFEAIAAAATTLCGTDFTGLFRFDGNLIHFEAQHGWDPEDLAASQRAFPQPPGEGSVTARAILAGAVVQVADVSQDPDVVGPLRSFRTVLSVPMLQAGRPLGAITAARRAVGPFSEPQIALLRTFAEQAVIAIANVRLFTELQTSNRELRTALDQQTATSEVLRTIAQAQTHVQPVFDTIVQSAARLCHAALAAVFLTDGRMVYEPANFGGSPEALAATRARFPRPVDMDSTAGIAILTRSVFHVPDTEDPSVIEHLRQSGRLAGFRSAVTVPMLREGEAVGAVLVARREPGRFADAELGLLKTFADQAVIAVENVRLFKELEGANHELSVALANMSHELRTPLNAIIGFSEVLSERMFGELNEKQEEYLKDIYASGTHLLSLINDILDLSKIEAGRMELELTDFHLPTAIENALILVRERAGRRGITLEYSVDGRLGEIRGDERKVKQVLLNLLSNALKFTPEGGRVEVRAGMVDDKAEISVTDTGVGIAAEDQEAVFQEFRQVGTADKKAEGTGLGLTLCRKFVESHGGKIWVTSQVGVGSTFTFTIPVRRGEQARVPPGR